MHNEQQIGILLIQTDEGHMDGRIKHSGIIDSVGDGVVRVRIEQSSACASCRAANHCSASESKEKIIDVYQPRGGLRVGDQVTVVASAGVGARAVVLGFLVPFVLLVAAVWLLMRLTNDEPLSALVGIACLVPYYLVLYFCRERLRRTLSFQIE